MTQHEGTLDQGGAESVIRSLVKSRASGVLRLSSGKHSVELGLSSGDLVAAEAGEADGVDAVHRACTFSSGGYQFDASSSSSGAPLGGSTSALLLEVDRNQARWERYLHRIGTLDVAYSVDVDAAMASGIPDALRAFIETINEGETLRDVVYASDMTDITALRMASKLVEKGLANQASTAQVLAPEPGQEDAAASWLEGHSGVFENPFKKIQEKAVEEAFGSETNLPEDLPLVVSDEAPADAPEPVTPEPVTPEPVASAPDETFVSADSPRARILAQTAPEATVTEEPSADDASSEVAATAEESEGLDDDWFNPGVAPDPHDFEIDYKKGSKGKYLVVAGLFLGLGLYYMSGSSGPAANSDFVFEAQVGELDKYLDDQSCVNAKNKFDYILKQGIRPGEQLELELRSGRIKSCTKNDQQILREKGVGGVAVTGGDFSMQTSADLARAAIAGAVGENAIDISTTRQLKTMTQKHFNVFHPYGSKLMIRLEDIRRTMPEQPGGSVSVGLKLTFKAKKKTDYSGMDFKLFDNTSDGEPRHWVSSNTDAFLPIVGKGKVMRGRSVSGWVTFHGVDAKAKFPSIEYHPFWEPRAFGAGLADDLSPGAAPAGASLAPAPEPEVKQPPIAEISKAGAEPKSKPSASKAKTKKVTRAVKPRVSKVRKSNDLPRIVSSDKLAKARAYQKKRDSRRVIAEARKVLRSQPGNGEAYYMLGWGLIQQGDFHGARVNLSKGTSLGGPPDAWYNLGLAFQMLGDDVAAAKALKRFVSLAPGHPNAPLARETLEALQ
jgi:hypothetical protein